MSESVGGRVPERAQVHVCSMGVLLRHVLLAQAEEHAVLHGIASSHACM